MMKAERHSRTLFFARGFFYSLAAIAIPFQFARPYTGIAAVALVAVSLTAVTRKIFARHREVSRAAEGDVTVALRAAVPLAANILWLLGGITTAFFAAAVILDPATRGALFPLQTVALIGGELSNAETFFASTAVSNLLFCAGAFAIAAAFREVGVALTIAWTGSFWGVGFVAYFASRGQTIGLTGTVLGVLAVLAICPALVGSGAVGLFLSRGATKYGIGSETWRNILRTSLRILGAAALLTLVSAGLTAFAQANLLLRVIFDLL